MQQEQPAGASYTVVARRFRPQSFDQLVGQRHLVQALENAIQTNRVGHAYLFTGARGVGKTSTARILSKALNCAQGPSTRPCGTCDSCRSIAAGSDVDVIEIDGASNRGIDEIRQLRSNVSVRPSRSRYKLYIIDEVHMLTGPAFNALLKTLEEPPAHVKFIFCTTDPEKIPITVLSRCQRFDFAPVTSEEIIKRLETIAQHEGLSAEPEVFRLLARQAAGSVRDSQSLLEQLLAFGSRQVTADDVHALFGTARGSHLVEFLEGVRLSDARLLLELIDRLIAEGVDPVQLSEQLLGATRDALSVASGCDAEMLRFVDEEDYADLAALAGRLGVANLLAAAQVLDQALSRMHLSNRPRLLLEIAAVRLCAMGDLSRLADVLESLPVPPASDAAGSAGSARTAAGREPGLPAAPAAPAKGPPKKSVKPTDGPADAAQVAAQPDPPLAPETALQIWQQTLEEIGDTTADLARSFQSIAISAPNRLVVTLNSTYNKEMCERPERRSRLEAVMSRLAGRTMRVDFEVREGSCDPPSSAATQRIARHQQVKAAERDPFVLSAMQTMDASIEEVVLKDDSDNPPSN